MYKVSEDIRSTHGQDGAIVLAIHTGQVLRLNPTGSLILQQLQHGETESEIVEAISQRFRVSSAEVRADVCIFLESLEQHGLIYELDGNTGR
jgi:hypothetical protein